VPLYVALDHETLVKLRRLAQRERRRPQDQAALILEQALTQPEPPSGHDGDRKPGAGHGARAGASR
jgi:hypothetical protein